MNYNNNNNYIMDHEMRRVMEEFIENLGGALIPDDPNDEEYIPDDPNDDPNYDPNDDPNYDPNDDPNYDPNDDEQEHDEDEYAGYQH